MMGSYVMGGNDYHLQGLLGTFTACLADVQTAQGSSKHVNTDIWIRATVCVYTGLHVNGNVTCKYVSYGSTLLF